MKTNNSFIGAYWIYSYEYCYYNVFVRDTFLRTLCQQPVRSKIDFKLGVCVADEYDVYINLQTIETGHLLIIISKWKEKNR